MQNTQQKQTSAQEYNSQNKQNQAIWQKYKTSLCRHFQQTGSCSLGKMCSFAHGHAEKRNLHDPMPTDFPGPEIVGALHSNYKT